MTNIVPRIGNSTPVNPLSSGSSNNDNSSNCFSTILDLGETYQVSRLKVPARCHLPMQSGLKTSKHLTILSGIVHITLEDDVMVLVADESIYIPQGALHSLENRANDTAVIVSVDYTA